MGVSGAGKSTLGALLARRLGCDFLDGDDFHPPANIARMAAGRPLDDADRAPWLERLNQELRARAQRGTPVVLACSALKNAYREQLLRGIPEARLAFLEGSQALIAGRVAARAHRYMPAHLLASQFEALEPPREALRVDISASMDACIEGLLAALAAPSAPATPANPASPGQSVSSA